MRTTPKRPAAAITLLLLAGCTVGPDFHSPDNDAPAGWFSSSAPARKASVLVNEPVDPQWWALFNDPELTDLETRVATANLDVRTAVVRIAEARAQRGVVASDQYPQLNGNASYTREKPSNQGVFTAFGGSSATSTPGTSANGTGFGAGGIPSAGIPPFDIYQYGLDATWEIDLWGKVRRSVESADASIVQSDEAARSALVSALAEVARDYIQLRGQQETLRITQANLGTAQQSVTLTRQRAAGGISTDLDVANAQAQVDSIAAQIPLLEQQIAASINAISLLLGEPPQALRAELEPKKPVPPVPPRVPIGVPAELARRRPDIRQAEAKLHSATADIGVATADFYPQVSLTGSFGIQAIQAKDLFNIAARQYALGPTITLPIFQGGRITSQVELRKADQQEAAIAYAQTVLQAFHDVDNAMTAYQTEQRRRDQLAAAVQNSSRALSLAQQQYTAGVTDFLQVLDAQRTLLQAQQQLSDSTANVSTNLVALYKALGGGWETSMPQPAVAADAAPAKPS